MRSDSLSVIRVSVVENIGSKDELLRRQRESNKMGLIQGYLLSKLIDSTASVLQPAQETTNSSTAEDFQPVRRSTLCRPGTAVVG